jgi:hypothetical protein
LTLIGLEGKAWSPSEIGWVLLIVAASALIIYLVYSSLSPSASRLAALLGAVLLPVGLTLIFHGQDIALNLFSLAIQLESLKDALSNALLISAVVSLVLYLVGYFLNKRSRDGIEYSPARWLLLAPLELMAGVAFQWDEVFGWDHSAWFGVGALFCLYVGSLLVRPSPCRGKSMLSSLRGKKAEQSLSDSELQKGNINSSAAGPAPHRRFEGGYNLILAAILVSPPLDTSSFNWVAFGLLSLGLVLIGLVASWHTRLGTILILLLTASAWTQQLVEKDSSWVAFALMSLGGLILLFGLFFHRRLETDKAIRESVVSPEPDGKAGSPQVTPANDPSRQETEIHSFGPQPEAPTQDLGQSSERHSFPVESPTESMTVNGEEPAQPALEEEELREEELREEELREEEWDPQEGNERSARGEEVRREEKSTSSKRDKFRNAIGFGRRKESSAKGDWKRPGDHGH